MLPGTIRPIFLQILLFSMIPLGIGCPEGSGIVGDDDDDGDDDTADGGDVVADIQAALHEEFASIVVVTWDQRRPARGWVEYSFDDGTWLASPALEREAGPAEELLLGIPYEDAVQIRVVQEEDGGAAQTFDGPDITTGAMPIDDLPGWTVLTADPERYDSSRPYLFISLIAQGEATGTGILDRRGRVVWMRPNPAQTATIQAQPSYDGQDLLIDQSTYWSLFDGGAASQVVRIKIDGTVLATYDTPGLHHPFAESPDGDLVWGAYSGYNETLEVLSPAGQQHTLFDCQDVSHMLVGEHYFASNTIRFNDVTGTITYTLYSHETILELDPQSGSLVRHFGHQDQAYAFEPSDMGFWWPHGGHYTEAGTLLTSSQRGPNSDELVVREYEVDEQDEVLELVWSFGDDEGVVSPVMGEAHRLPNGNTLHNYATPARLREITPEGDVVWDLAFDNTQVYTWELGRSTPLADLYAFAP